MKFFFTNWHLIPNGTRRIERREQTIEEQHKREGELQDFPEGGLGAQREGRVDTGQHRQFENVDLRSTWGELKMKLGISNVHLFVQERSSGMKKPVITITFGKNPQGQGTEINRKIIDEIEKNFVNNITWGIVHHWTNLGQGNITLNCLQRQPRMTTP